MSDDYDKLYPVWDPDKFTFPGTSIFEQVCVVAFRAVRHAIRKKGGECPCCGQHIQVYQRSIYKRMAKCLIWVVAQYQRSGGEWVSIKDGPLFHGGDNAKLVYWHLLIRNTHTSNLYKPTQLAVDFTHGKVSVPKHAFVYNGKVRGFSQEHVTIKDCLEGDFDLSDIGISAWGLN